jgi:hypothetical protein
MASVVRSIGPAMTAAAFKKQRHTFNRVAEPGLVHVVNFQMGRFPIGSYEIPVLRPNLYGKFTVNLGVFVREVYEVTQRSEAPAFVQEYACEFRVRLGDLRPASGDGWWSLQQDAGALALELAHSLARHAEPWFARHATRDAILEVPAHADLPKGWPARAPVALAAMLVNRDDRSGACAALRDYLAEERRNPRNPKHRDWVLDVARRLGLEEREVV